MKQPDLQPEQTAPEVKVQRSATAHVPSLLDFSTDTSTVTELLLELLYSALNQ